MEGPATPPDGGWGWMVVLGAALINMVNQALFANYGLIFGEKLKEMADGHATGIMLVMSGSVLVTNFSGLLVSPLMRRLSVRSITMFGILCVGTGMICCSFSTEIWEIMLGYSLLTGMGLGLLASVTFLAINSYFSTKKSTAVGLAMAGTSVGQMAFPTFISMLLKKYGFSRATLILGLLSYTGIFGAFLFKPLCVCKKQQGDESSTVEEGTKNDYDVNFNDDIKDTAKESEKRLMGDNMLPEGEKPITKKGSAAIIVSNGLQANYKDSAIAMASSCEFMDRTKDESQTWTKKVVKALGLNLLKDLSFVHIVIGLSFGYLSTVTFSTFYPMFLQDEAMFSIMETSYCMTALSFADIIGRITVSEVCRRMKLGNKTSFMLGCVLLAACRSFTVEMTQLKYIFFMSFSIGYFRAVTVINQNLVISEYIEKDQLPSAVGLNMVSKGLLIVTAGQALGFLKDLFSYAICIHILNVILIIVVISWSIELLIKRSRTKK